MNNLKYAFDMIYLVYAMLFMALSRYSAISNIAGNGITVNTTKRLILGLINFINHLYHIKFSY